MEAKSEEVIKTTGEINFKLDDHIYNIEDLDSLLLDFDFITSSKLIDYCNTPFAFDIETTSFMDEDLKSSLMYAFVFGINGKCIIARTWNDFLLIINKLIEKYQLCSDKRIIIYVHNLQFEFQFIRKFFTWQDVFATDTRQVLYAVTTSGIEFRCSYLLSGYSLAKVGENLLKYKVNKMVGDLDYKLYRHEETPLNDKELKYILNDGLVVMAFIKEEIERNHNNINLIPLTNTGYVRRYARDYCYYEGGKHDNHSKTFIKYRRIMNALKIQSVLELNQAIRAFHGGFTHANAIYSGEIMYDVTSFDFTSSYPAVAIYSDEFPMGRLKRKVINDYETFKHYLTLYWTVFDVKFNNLRLKDEMADCPISYSKCMIHKNCMLDNGRIYTGEEVALTCTGIDFEIYENFYEWDSIQIKNFRYCYRGYLPTNLVKAIIKLYKDKTELKGIKGKETEYMHSKGMLNSVYGCMVTSIVKDNAIYNDNDEWSKQAADVDKSLKAYNSSIKRFLSYWWGVTITSLAMRNLFTGIYACGMDYIYADTDSIKILNGSKHMEYINKFNDNVIKQLHKACNYHKIPFEDVSPKTKNGETKIIGVWDFDGHYKRFKTLRAKTYLTEDDNGEIHLTAAGINKTKAVPYMKELAKNENKDIFKVFNDDLYLPSEYSGKNTLTYIDEERKGIITDYLGNSKEYESKSGIYISESEYSLNLLDQYIDYLLYRKGNM